MSRQLKLHDQVSSTTISGWKGDDSNPMAACFGRLQGKRCGDCSFLVPVTKPGLDFHGNPIVNIIGHECLKRGVGLGRQTRHSMDWNACVKFTQLDKVNGVACGNQNIAQEAGPAAR